MWIEKLADGVLQVETPIGARYIRPNLIERAYLLWIFRNFDSLPQQVLGVRQQRLIDRLCSEQAFVPMAIAGGFEKPILGRIERRLPAPAEVPVRRTVAGTSSLPERRREAASA